MADKPDPCAVAMTRYVDKRRWLNLWTVLLFIFGATIIIFCVIAIMLFIRETWLPGALTVLGTIVNGAAIAWVVNRRTEAEKEERDAFKEFNNQCGGKKSVIGYQGPLTHIPTERELKTMAWKSLFRDRQPDEF
jgi:hypothetical protein